MSWLLIFLSWLATGAALTLGGAFIAALRMSRKALGI